MNNKKTSMQPHWEKQPLQQPTQQQQGTKKPAAAPIPEVSSSLPPMQPTLLTQPTQQVRPQTNLQQGQVRPKIDLRQQQTDPRFAQALAAKLQQDVNLKQTQLTEQKKKFEEELAKASGGVPAQQRISELLQKINAPAGQVNEADREAAVQELNRIQKLQYQGPTGLEGAANIAALAQIAGSPELLAQQYGIGELTSGDIAGLSNVPGLTQALGSAESLAESALSEEEKAAQRSSLAKLLTEGAKTQTEAGIKSEEQKMLAGLSEAQRAELEAKRTAFDKIKEGLFLTGQISKNDLRKLGLNPDDPEVAKTLSNLIGLDTRKIQGIADPRLGFDAPKGPKDLATLESRIRDLQRRQREEGLQLTPEQDKLISLYNKIAALGRDQLEGQAINYATTEDLARINALRRLRGQSLYTEADVGKAGEFGKLSQSTLSGLIGDLREGSKYGHEDRIQEMKEYQKYLPADRKLKDLYNKILSGGAQAGKYINELEEFAKANPNNPHTNYVAKRLERFKGLFGWDAGLVKDFVTAQTDEVNRRIGDYESITSPDKSATTRKIRLI